MVILLIVELNLHLGDSLIMSSYLIFQLNDLILVNLHIVSLFCLYLIDHLEELFLFSLEVVNLDSEVVQLCCKLILGFLISVDDVFQLSHSYLVEILNLFQLHKVFICLIEFHLILLL